MTVTFRESNDVGKTHRTADCHDEGGIGHALGELVHGCHRIQRQAAKE